jgi:hypothetical protein
LPPDGRSTSAQLGSKGLENGADAHVVGPSEVRQTPAVAIDPRAPVLATSLPPVVPKGRDLSSPKPAPSAPELAPGMSDARDSITASLEAVAGPLDRLDRYAAAIVPRSEDVASAHSDPILDDFYAQLASLTSEVGAFSEWERPTRERDQPRPATPAFLSTVMVSRAGA